MTQSYAVGIDIGLDGGVAVLDLEGNLAFWEKMPTTLARRGKSVIDVRAVAQSLFSRREAARLVVVEDVHSFGHEARSACFSFGRSTGRLEALLELWQMPYEAVAPQEWKAEILSGTKRDKAAAIGYALSRHPASGLPQHDGVADAICLAEFARRRIVGKGK